MRPRLEPVALASLLAVSVVAAQQGSGQPPQDPPAQPPVFRTGTNLVRVDVMVTNRAGQPVRDLTAADFEVKENGQAQTVTSFKLVEASGQPTDDYSLPIRSTEHAAAEAARDDVRVFVIFWDEYHIGEFASAIRAREQLTEFVLEAFGPTDLVALMDPLTTTDSLRFTRDRRALADAIHKLKGRRGVYVPPRSIVEENHFRAQFGVERARAEVTASALKSVMAHLGSLREGPKSILFVSEALGPLGRDEHTILSDLMRTAHHNNTSVFTFDPRGLQVGMRSSTQLATLAYGTGARPHSTNDMRPGLVRAVARSSAFYLLGYAPPDSPLDGKFRNISVRVKRDGIDVQARRGYWQLRGEEVARARTAAAAAALPPDIEAALHELTPANSHRPVELWAGWTGGPSRAITVAWAARETGPAVRDQVASLSIEVKRGGTTIYSGPVAADGTTFDAPSAEVIIVATARNAAGDIVDVQERTLTVPDATAVPLAIDTPVVYRVRTPHDARLLDAGKAPRAATRVFTPTERLRVRTAVQGTLAVGATLSASLLGPRGDRLAALPIRPALATGAFDVDLPLSSIALGEFLIRFDAVSGDQRAQALVAFRVVR
jgi:VWFA-related protein